jgi:hypothetical protein
MRRDGSQVQRLWALMGCVQVPLGSTQQWRIVSLGRSACPHKMSMGDMGMMDMDDESHPFHMHINHFQVVHSTASCNFDYSIGE